MLTQLDLVMITVFPCNKYQCSFSRGLERVEGADHAGRRQLRRQNRGLATEPKGAREGPQHWRDRRSELSSHCPIESLSTASRWWFTTADRLRYDKAAHSLRALHAWMQLFDGRVGCCCFFVQGEGTIPQHLLRKYIMYARNNVRPQLHNIDQDKVSPPYNGLQKNYAHDVTNVVIFIGVGCWLLSVTRFARRFSTLSPRSGGGVCSFKTPTYDTVRLRP